MATLSKDFVHKSRGQQCVLLDWHWSSLQVDSVVTFTWSDFDQIIHPIRIKVPYLNSLIKLDWTSLAQSKYKFDQIKSSGANLLKTWSTGYWWALLLLEIFAELRIVDISTSFFDSAPFTRGKFREDNSCSLLIFSSTRHSEMSCGGPFSTFTFVDSSRRRPASCWLSWFKHKKNCHCACRLLQNDEFRIESAKLRKHVCQCKHRQWCSEACSNT